jgi:hypothetical protein
VLAEILDPAGLDARVVLGGFNEIHEADDVVLKSFCGNLPTFSCCEATGMEASHATPLHLDGQGGRFAVGDLNGDGKRDVAAISYTPSSEIEIFLNE